MTLKEMLLTFLTIFLMAACAGGGASPAPTQAPIPIEFNKSAAHIDLSNLISVPSDAVETGTDVCDAIQNAFVQLMQKFEGVTALNNTQLTAGGATLDISFDAWGEHGCSGNAETFPVCYQVYVDHFIMLAGFMTSPKSGDEMEGEVGTIWLEFDPSGATLKDAVGQTLSMRVDYDRSDMNAPAFHVDSSGDPDDSGAIGDVTARCLITNEDALGALPMVLLQMYQTEGAGDDDVKYVARTDGATTSVKIEGGPNDTGGSPECIDNSGAPAPDCGSTDVSGVSYPAAPEGYSIPDDIAGFNDSVDCAAIFGGTCSFTNPDDPYEIENIYELHVDSTMSYENIAALGAKFGWPSTSAECICRSAATAGGSSCFDYTMIDTYTTRCSAAPATITCVYSPINDCGESPVDDCTAYYTYDSTDNLYYNCEIDTASGACKRHGGNGIGACLLQSDNSHGCQGGSLTADCSTEATMADCNNSFMTIAAENHTCYWGLDPVTGIARCQMHDEECFFYDLGL